MKEGFNNPKHYLNMKDQIFPQLNQDLKQKLQALLNSDNQLKYNRL